MALQRLVRLFRGTAAPVPVVPNTKRFECGHNGQSPFEIAVLGTQCTFEESTKCAVCASEYLNTFSTLCACCRRPIFPGHGICCDGDGQFPYTHAGYCGDAAGYCGTWGEGQAKRFDNPRHLPVEDGGQVRPAAYN